METALSALREKLFVLTNIFNFTYSFLLTQEIKFPRSQELMFMLLENQEMLKILGR
jgi:hypothetical protein